MNMENNPAKTLLWMHRQRFIIILICYGNSYSKIFYLLAETR